MLTDDDAYGATEVAGRPQRTGRHWVHPARLWGAILAVVGVILLTTDVAPFWLGFLPTIAGTLAVVSAGIVGRLNGELRPRRTVQREWQPESPAQRRVTNVARVVAVISTLFVAGLLFQVKFGEGDAPQDSAPKLLVWLAVWLISLRVASRNHPPDSGELRPEDIHDPSRRSTKVLIGILLLLVGFVAAVIISVEMGWTDPASTHDDELSWVVEPRRG